MKTKMELEDSSKVKHTLGLPSPVDFGPRETQAAAPKWRQRIMSSPRRLAARISRVYVNKRSSAGPKKWPGKQDTCCCLLLAGAHYYPAGANLVHHHHQGHKQASCALPLAKWSRRHWAEVAGELPATVAGVPRP